MFLLSVRTALLMQLVEKKFIFLLDLFLENDPSKIITPKSGSLKNKVIAIFEGHTKFHQEK